MSYSHSTLLGALWPQQAAALDKDAEQVSFARNYAAAHFPSDVAAGAYIGAAAATYALAGRK